MNTLRWVTAVSAALVLGACGDERLVGLRDELRPSAQRIDFGRVLVGSSVERTLTLTNASRAELRIHIDVPAPFASGLTDAKVPAGAELAVPLSFEPASVGARTSTVEIHVGEDVLTVELAGEGVDASLCGAAPPCQVASIDPETGACMFANAVDGASCSTTCIADGACVDGVCMGAAISCEDGDACTSDSCAADQGCIHAPVTCAAPTDPCKAAACDPILGCSSVDVADGTSCGPTDCITAHVCMSGACVVRPAVDGMECAPATPCSEASRCLAGTCAAGAEIPLQPLWSVQAGPNRVFRDTPSQDAFGNAYVAEVDAEPCCSSNPELVSWTKDGQLRFRNPVATDGLIFIDDVLDRVYVSQGPNVTALNRAGKQLWQTTVGVDGSTQLLLTLPDQRSVVIWRADAGLKFRLISLDADTGLIRWDRTVQGNFESLARDGAGRLVLDFNPPDSPTLGPEEYLDPGTGPLLFTGDPWFVYAWTGDMRIVSGPDGKVAVLDGDGAQLFETSDPIDVSGAVIGREHLYWIEWWGSHRIWSVSKKDFSVEVAAEPVGGSFRTFVTATDGLMVFSPSSGGSPGWITGVQPGDDGLRRTYACDVPGADAAGMALGDERVYVLRPSERVDVYALPGVKPAAWGYTVSWYGSEARGGPKLR